MKRILPLIALVGMTQMSYGADTSFVQACAVPGGAQSTTTLSVLPQPVMATLRTHLPNLSPADGPFNATDIILQGQRGLNQRFMRAFVRDSRWVVAYEHGGIGYHHHVVAIQRSPGGQTATLLANIVTVGPVICTEMARWASPAYPMEAHW